MAEFVIPPGKGVPLVDLATDLFPAPTMGALDDRYAQPVRLTQAEYDALTPTEKDDPHYIYLIYP
jgi:hypothetical protein